MNFTYTKPVLSLIIFLIIITPAMGEDKKCFTKQEFTDEVMDIIYREGMVYMTEEDYLESLDEYLWETVDKWKEQGIIVTSTEKISEMVDEEVARIIAESDFTISNKQLQESNKDIAPYMTKDQQFYAYCAGHLRFEDMILNPQEKATLNETMLDNMCKAFGR